MKTLNTSIYIIFLSLITQLAFASGQRSAVITVESIIEYQELTMDKTTPNIKLNYIGTVNNLYHILMVTETSYSQHSDGRVGMPWSHVSKYKTSVNNISIINGWDITNNIKQGIRIRPSDCPRLYLSFKQKEYILSDKKHVKSRCIPTRI